jgi:D-glycero-alpha-D-manno-heptose-7-phosphate kinase
MKIMIVRARAPLRIGIAGGGTDVSPYCDKFGGYVLNSAIQMYAYAMIEPIKDNMVIFEARDQKEVGRFNSDDLDGDNGCLALHHGVYRRIVQDFLGDEPLAIRMVTYADAPPGSGLGTSSTLVVAMLKAFVEYLNLPLGEYDIAHLAYQIERIDLGLKGGKQDQYAATFGGFNFMEFYDADRVIVNPLRIKNWIISELESSFVIYFTGRSRDSDKIISKQIQNVETNKDGTTNALHKIKKDALHMKEALLKGDIRGFGEWLDHSWREKKKVSDCITNPMIDEVYDLAKRAGAFAGKVSGAGGGGFMMFLIDPLRRVEVLNALSSMPGKAMNCHFAKWGTQGWSIK